MKNLTAILERAVLMEAHVSSLRSKMMMNFTPGCLVLEEESSYHNCL